MMKFPKWSDRCIVHTTHLSVLQSAPLISVVCKPKLQSLMVVHYNITHETWHRNDMVQTIKFFVSWLYSRYQMYLFRISAVIVPAPYKWKLHVIICLKPSTRDLQTTGHSHISWKQWALVSDLANMKIHQLLLLLTSASFMFFGNYQDFWCWCIPHDTFKFYQYDLYYE